MLEQLQMSGQVTQEAINPVIRADPEITLMDLCCKKKYRGGIRFLLQRCQIQPTADQQKIIQQLWPDVVTMKSKFENQGSMADVTSRNTNDTYFNMHPSQVQGLNR